MLCSVVACVHVVMNISSVNYQVSFPILAHSHVCGMETRTLHNKKHTVMYGYTGCMGIVLYELNRLV